ncbi:MAG TPA: hypothetical protein VHK69_08570 [Chitinophagaceae bacterium]|nr:hypothetical protein [Chitinophagaceae bacterium]
MQLPQELLDSLHGVPGFNREAFVNVHAAAPAPVSVRLNPAKAGNTEAFAGTLFGHSPRRPELSPVPWSRYGYYLSERPSFTFDPLFHAGLYYVQEASSMFLEQALRQAADLSQSLRVLDLCAAPGGKSTHLQSLISPGSLLVSNEVIRARAGVLRQNIVKWGASNVLVTSNDPEHFGRLPGFFDVIVADAPCSGSGLFRREPEAIGEWSPGAVQLCCGRQKRILADVLPALKEGGLLVYSTCSYSREENEEVGDWLAGQGMQAVALTLDAGWGIEPAAGAASIGYRFFPDKVQGEGFYLAVFRKTGSTPEKRIKPASLVKADKKETALVEPWLQPGEWLVYREPHLHALPAGQAEAYGLVKSALYVQHAGVTVGAAMRDKLVPDHALALSTALAGGVPATDVPYETAVRYLQREELSLERAQKGWQLLRYEGHNLGWINALQNRINNYYPKEFRILKRTDDSGFEK